MSELHFKFEEDWTKTVVAIESDRYFGRTDGQTYTQMILYLSSAMNCIGQTITLIDNLNCIKLPVLSLIF